MSSSDLADIMEQLSAISIHDPKLPEYFTNLQTDLKAFAAMMESASSVAGPSQTASRLKVSKPDSFHGNPKEDVEAWLFTMNQYCVLTLVPADQKVAFATTYLKGHAAKWVQMLGATIPTSWTQFQ
jgi:hypothetical protein